MSTGKERESLAAKLEYHAAQEGKILEEYRVLSGQLGNSSAGMLVNQILTDEETHHLLLKTMAAWLRDTPRMAVRHGANRAEILTTTQRLQRQEQETIAVCRNLRSHVPNADEDLIGCLLDVMALDCEKHHRLLVAVEKMLQT